jgi:hypothetical protein
MENMEENSEKIRKIWKKIERKDLENMEER